ncbi:MAG: hypothetical protein U0R64_02485 [Candidatus Nanopelagicales bacterium]
MTGRPPVPAADVAEGDTREQEQIAAAAVGTLRWRDTTFIECDLVWSRVGTVDLSGGRVVDSVVPSPDVEELAAGDSTWRSARMVDGRVGALVLARAHIDSLSLTGMRIGYLDLRSAAVSDLTVADCRIDTVDLTGGRIERASFVGCHIGELIVSHADLSQVDLRGAEFGGIDGVAGLRGATVSPGQLLALAPILADALGVLVDDEA